MTSPTTPLVTRRTFAAALAGSFALLPGLIRAEGGLKGGQDSDTPDEDIDADLQEIGMVDAETYVSPQFGYELTWKTPWAPDSEDAGVSDTDEEIDSFRISWDETATVTDAMIDLTGWAATPPAAVSFFEEMQSEESLAEMMGNAYDIDIIAMANETGAMEIAYLCTGIDDPDTTLVMVNVYRMVSDQVMVMANAMILDRETSEDVLPSMVDDLELDGEPLMLYLTPDEILEGLTALEHRGSRQA